MSNLNSNNNSNEIDQQTIPLNNYSAQSYNFSPYYFYSGYIYNANSTNTLQIQITPSTQAQLKPLYIPPNTSLTIKNMSIKKIDIASGYYMYAFVGSTCASGDPEFGFENFLLETSQHLQVLLAEQFEIVSNTEIEFNLGDQLASIGYNIIYLPQKVSFILSPTLSANTSMTVYIYGLDANHQIIPEPLASIDTFSPRNIANVDLYGFRNVNYIYIEINVYSQGNIVDFQLSLMA